MLVATCAYTESPVTPFSVGDEGLAGWKPQVFKNIPATRYAMVKNAEGKTVLHAQSEQGASGMVFKQDLDISARSVLSWSWKVDRLLDGVDEQTREGDDYVARVYVVFKTRWNQIKPNTLVYVWSSMKTVHPPGYVSPYTDLAKMIPVDQGAVGLGEWQFHRRNLQQDIEKFFGAKVDKILAIAVMTDADSSGQRAEAWYGDIALVPEKSK
jgi:hypothetical protein